MEYYNDESDKSDEDYENYGSYEADHNIEEHDTKNQFSILSQKDLEEERDKEINEAMNNLCLDRDKSILVLIYYNWNMDKILTNWYDDVEKNSIKCGIKLSEETEKLLLKENVQKNSEYCQICMCDKDETFKNLDCGHSFCGDCWKEYLREHTKDLHTILKTPCMQHNCTLIVYERFFFEILKDEKDLIEKVKKGIIKNFIDKNDDIKECPNPHCSFIIKTSFHFLGDCSCLCGKSFCFKCYKEPHRPCTCEMVTKWEKRMKNESEDDLWVKANTKECPHCHQKIERSFGCNYMFCDPKAGGCGKAFCYVCEVDWAKHSQDHFKCNKYTEAVMAKEKEADMIKRFLKRYTFYFDRYINYKNAVKQCEEKLRKDLDEKLSIIVSIKNYPLNDLKFISDALNTVIKGKRSLEYTYIFGFYMKDDNNKSMFEFSQSYLERNADNLHQCLIGNSINELIQTDNYEEFTREFSEYRNRVLNLLNATNKYQENLLFEIENKYLMDIDQQLYNQSI